jgi:hypothetical protein
MADGKREPTGTSHGGEFAKHKRTDSAVGLNSDFRTVTLDDGNRYTIPERIADEFRGVTADGYNVISIGVQDDSSDDLMGLTPCCNASATGTEYGIACRSCHSECDPMLGGEITQNQIAVRPRQSSLPRDSKTVEQNTDAPTTGEQK